MTELELVQRLNRHCYCVGTDVPALQSWLERDLRERGLMGSIVSSHPHLFSSLPVFLSAEANTKIGRVIQAIESVVAMPAYREAVLANAPPIARIHQSTRGVLFGYDFHIADDGPKLIEINTNAGGAMLNVALTRAQQVCCPEVRDYMGTANNVAALEAVLFDMFQAEWRLARGAERLTAVAIVDEAPETQYLYPEFLLFQKLFESHGVKTVIVDPSELHVEDEALMHGDQRIDLVYNRLTDFYLEKESNASLHKAYVSKAAVITPHPEAHAIYASKRNLVLLTDEQALRALGVAQKTIDVLLQGIPRVRLVDSPSSEHWWTDRKQWFFKPVNGFGSRGSYRGDKLTRKAFSEVMKNDYVAQAFSPPSERWQGEESPLKFDVRNYVYAGDSQLIAARLYQGQTTNFRTEGGGFAPVYITHEIATASSTE
ncbi:MAG: hypothetical protein H7Y02_00275 [Candidatus Obscuribacterales bacterium]|nr:hypothetical protein [Steroidobacteraceae bacterium]